MPKKYEAIRDACKRKGGSDKGCKTKAAKIYNATRGKKPPVTRTSHGRKK